MSKDPVGRRPALVHVLGFSGALLLGLASSHLTAVVVGVATLLPLASHLRHVGLRRAIAEPSAATIIVGFYLLVFPLRGLVIAASGYTDVFLARGPVSPKDLINVLLLGSFATTALVEAFYLAKGTERPLLRDPIAVLRPDSTGVVAMAALLEALALAALLGVFVQYGGLAGAQTAFLSHTKVLALQGATSISGSTWSIFAAPAVWAAVCIGVDSTQKRLVRMMLVGGAGIIVLAQLVVFGSRLEAIISLIGAWIVFYYSGRSIPAKRVLLAIPALVLLSVPIVSARPGGSNAGLSAVERYSRIAGYGVLDASLAVHQEPTEIRSKLTDPQRWFDLPGYFVPAALWHGRPNIETRRLDLYVAQTLGTQNDQTTGFPTTYVTEGWLYGGWPAALVISVLFGSSVGLLHRRLRLAPGARASPVSLLLYCFVVNLAFNYYKDGDMLISFVGNWRSAVYLALALFITGVWRPSRERGRRPAIAVPATFGRHA